MDHDAYPDRLIGTILDGVKAIAIVGASANAARPSYAVLRYLVVHGYRVFPVNPGMAGGTLQGLPVYASLADIPAPIDMVDIFRNSDAAGVVVDEALRLVPLPRVIWMQLTVRNDAAAARAEAAGLQVVMNRCPKIEYGRLSGESSWAGINSRILSSKVPKMAENGVQKRRLSY